jgi:hypothetical protein
VSASADDVLTAVALLVVNARLLDQLLGGASSRGRRLGGALPVARFAGQTGLGAGPRRRRALRAGHARAAGRAGGCGRSAALRVLAGWLCFPAAIAAPLGRRWLRARAWAPASLLRVLWTANGGVCGGSETWRGAVQLLADELDDDLANELGDGAHAARPGQAARAGTRPTQPRPEFAVFHCRLAA